MEKPESMPYSSLEAVLEGENIVFRPGKRRGILEIGCISTFCVFFLGFLMLAINLLPQRVFPLQLRYILVGVLVLGAYLFIRLLMRNLDILSRPQFELDDSHNELIVYLGDRTAKWSLPIDDVSFFIGLEQVAVKEGFDTALYAVLADREVRNLTDIMKSRTDIERNLKVIGFCCDKPAIYLEKGSIGSYLDIELSKNKGGLIGNLLTAAVNISKCEAISMMLPPDSHINIDRVMELGRLVYKPTNESR
ncbi:MAG: hypothetical protein ABFD64_09675 [Armatimonadota bacterium]